MGAGKRERFWTILCAHSNAVYALFVTGIILLLLTLLSLANRARIPPAGQAIASFNLVFVSAILLSSGYVLYRCHR